MPSYVRETLELHGSFPDLIPQDAPLTGWNSSLNVWFQNGETRRAMGDTPVFGAVSGGEPLAMVFYTDAAGEPFWVYATAIGLFAVDGTSYFDLSPAGWAPSSESVITISTFNGFVVVNDTVSGPFWWTGSTGDDFAKLPGWPSGWRCLSMRPHKGFLFAIGRLDAGGIQRVNWSDAAEAGSMPGTWDPQADNFAGFVDLLPASSPCVDGVSIRDEMLVFKGESSHAFAFVGGNSVFAVRKRFATVGLAGVDGWCTGPNDEFLFFGSDGDVYRSDGVNYLSVLDGVAQRQYYASADPDQLRRVCAATLFRSGTSLLAFPTQGAPAADLGIIYDWTSGELGFRSMPNVTCMAEGRMLSTDAAADGSWNADGAAWASDASAWNFSLAPATGDDVLAGSAAGFWWLTGETAETVPLAAYALKQGLSFGDASRRKTIGRVWPRLDGAAGERVTVRIGSQEESGGAVAWADAVDFAIGEDASVDLFAQGRFIAIELSAATGGPWRLAGLDVEYRGAGLW